MTKTTKSRMLPSAGKSVPLNPVTTRSKSKRSDRPFWDGFLRGASTVRKAWDKWLRKQPKRKKRGGR